MTEYSYIAVGDLVFLYLGCTLPESSFYIRLARRCGRGRTLAHAAAGAAACEAADAASPLASFACSRSPRRTTVPYRRHLSFYYIEEETCCGIMASGS